MNLRRDHPANYWCVVTQAEYLRQELRILDNNEILLLAINRILEVLKANHYTYLDDGQGRFDIYMLTREFLQSPILENMEEDLRMNVMDAFERLILFTAHPSGASILWGRSSGLNSIIATFLIALTLLCLRRSKNDARLLGITLNLIDRAIEEWWKDDTVSVHRDRMTHWYLGPFRIIEISLLFLASLAEAVVLLKKLIQKQQEYVFIFDRELFLEQDVWIPFDSRGCRVWCYRNKYISFQLPLIQGFNSDYVAAPFSPGVLEQIVDSGFACGVPVVEWEKTVASSPVTGGG